MAYSLIADCARMKWYMRLASRFMRAKELQIMMAPCKRSALWNVVRVDGLDFVRRCRYAPPGLALGFLDGTPALGAREFSRRREEASAASATPLECAAAPLTASRARL